MLKIYIDPLLRGHTIHILGLPERPFRAIKSGAKKIEVRTRTKSGTVNYEKFKKNHYILFTHNSTEEQLLVKITKIVH